MEDPAPEEGKNLLEQMDGLKEDDKERNSLFDSSVGNRVSTSISFTPQDESNLLGDKVAEFGGRSAFAEVTAD